MFDTQSRAQFIAPSRNHIRFGSGGSILTAARGQDEGLSLDAIAAHVPAVFAEQPHESRSERFVPIPSRMIIESLLKEGFKIVEARQGGSRVEGKREFTKHRLRLRHGNAPMVRTLGELYPEIVLTNGNDGTSAYFLEAGLYRLVCLNGMTAKDASFGGIKVRHSGKAEQVAHDVIDASFQVIEAMPMLIDRAGDMDATKLDARHMNAFARAAIELRWNSKDPEVKAPIEAARLLDARRREDAGNSMWNLLNVAQENLIKGGQTYRTAPTTERPRGTERTVSPIKDAGADSAINRALWVLASELQKVAA